MKKITIFTDGACSGNPGPGGWGAVLIYNDKVKKISGAEKDTTNNRMELMATIEALKALKTSCVVDLFTDSRYVKDGITKWLINWEKNSWLNSQKKPVKNKDLWQQLNLEVQKHKVNWYWVKGHSGHEQNDIADSLAVNAITKLKEAMKNAKTNSS